MTEINRSTNLLQNKNKIKTMKALYTFFLSLFLVSSVIAQEEYEKKAFSCAEQMSKAFNNRDYQKYVDFLLPSYYGNDPKQKGNYTTYFQNLLGSDTAKNKIVKVLKFVNNKGQFQALFLNRYHDKDGFIFGFSDDLGVRWFFTTFYSKEVQFEQIIMVIPSIDTSFAKIADPKFGKRINYQIGKYVAPFQYKDVNGNELHSDLLKGKIVVLNFWSITCGPCMTEIPELNKLVEKLKGENVVFIAPAFFTSYENIVNYLLPKHPFNYQIVIVSSDDYSIPSLPTHIIIDQDLKIISKIVGYSPDNIRQLGNTIDGLLKK